MSDELPGAPPKPRLRGVLHQEAFFVSLGAVVLLIARSSSLKAYAATTTYSFGLLFLFGMSAFYHRIQWNPRNRRLMKRLDHSAIFIFIAGSMTPFAILALPDMSSGRFLGVIWLMALIGVLQSIFWVKAPKWVTALLYVLAGWTVFPHLSSMRSVLSDWDVALLIAGGITYTIGSIFYVVKRPVLWPKLFGYHELFHLFTIVAAALHFTVIYSLIK